MSDDAVQVRLDRKREALISPGWTVVETERDFLRLALTETRLFIRGQTLCEWASLLAQARGWRVEEAASPVEELLAACPALELSQARQLYDLLGERYASLSGSVHADAILRALYPDGPWEGTPGLRHAAEWLLWLDEADPPSIVQPLLMQRAAIWKQACSEAEQPCYDTSDAPAARRLLEHWFRLDETGGQRHFDPFPLPVPARWLRAARDAWKSRAIATQGYFFEALRQQPMPLSLLEAAAEAVLHYWQAHQGRIDERLARQVAAYLSEPESVLLRALCPPPEPGALPMSFSGMLRWFEREYLPYRRWQIEHGGLAAQARCDSLAQEFARWCLSVYPAALHGGEGQEHLAITYSRRLRETRENVVTFWIILDGLPYTDAQTLITQLEAIPRLSLELCRPILSPLPTITQFAKPALVSGLPHVLLADPDPKPDFEGAVIIKRNHHPHQTLRDAQKGKVYVWSLTEPDETYHNRADQTLIRTDVDGILRTLARQIGQAALAVSNELPLRLIISTDHGRMLTAGQRTHSVPLHMQAHGRAAWGNSGKVFGASGYEIDSEAGIAYLDAHRFGLPDDCAVVLDSDVYLSGKEQFAHGGLYPEEVLAPWLEFVRDRVTPRIRSLVRGRGRAGRRGSLIINLENPSDVAVRLIEVRLSYGEREPQVLSLDRLLPAMTAQEEEITLDSWPDSIQVGRAQATLAFLMPNGVRFDFTPELALESEDYYRREAILEDLK